MKGNQDLKKNYFLILFVRGGLGERIIRVNGIDYRLYCIHFFFLSKSKI